MPIAFLRFDNHSTVAENRNGIFVYSGESSRYNEWAFRSKARFESADKEGKKNAMSMIIEGLRDEASQVAMDNGTEELMKETGFQKLVEAIHDIVYLHIRNEAR